MESERQIVRPLSSDEIKDGLVVKVLDAVETAIRDRLGKTCNLFGRAYPKFRGTVKIHLELDDFGLTTHDNSEASFTGEDGAPKGETTGVDVDLEIKETPPNQFRKETSQPITVAATEDGKNVLRQVRYQPRGKRKA